jgi:hypothetical protein
MRFPTLSRQDVEGPNTSPPSRVAMNIEVVALALTASCLTAVASVAQRRAAAPSPGAPETSSTADSLTLAVIRSDSRRADPYGSAPDLRFPWWRGYYCWEVASGSRPGSPAARGVVRTQLRTHVPSQCLRGHEDDPRNSDGQVCPPYHVLVPWPRSGKYRDLFAALYTRC